MTPLFEEVRQIIRNEGPMTLERYMTIVLHDPERGYYRCNNPLGAQGDFITAPEVSQMFGEMLGLWCLQMWEQLGKPAPFVMLELGPGRGTLLQDLLRATAKVPGFQDAMRLCVLESNATLRGMQMEKLASYAPTFLDSLDQLPAIPMLFLANEFFDTLPMRQFMKTDEGWCERLIDCWEDKLVFVQGHVQDAPALGPMQPVGQVGGAYSGWYYEVSPLALRFVRHLAAHLLRHRGAGLIVDYGYAAAPGIDTVQAYYKHAHAHPLDNPGEADVTADVDFSALAYVAETSGARAIGPIGQGAFLQNLGIEIRAAQLKRAATPAMASAIEEDLDRLIGPAHMGVMFKAMAMTAPSLREAPGF